MKSWTSGSRSDGPICDVCQGDLVEVRLTSSGTGETPADGYAPHLVFVPEFGQGASDKLGGTGPTRTRPVEFRLDLAPFWAPYRGQLYLDGGTATEYTVEFTRSRCQPRPADDPTITLRNVTITPIQLPRGVRAISVPADADVKLAAAGDLVTLSLVAGWRQPIGSLAQGTVAADTGTLQMVTCWVKL